MAALTNFCVGTALSVQSEGLAGFDTVSREGEPTGGNGFAKWGVVLTGSLEGGFWARSSFVFSRVEAEVCSPLSL